jgi:hypothetical protein
VPKDRPRVPSERRYQDNPAIWQDFNEGFYQALKAESQLLKKYGRMIFLTKYFTNRIIEKMNEGLTRFAESENMPFIHHTLFANEEIKGKINQEKENSSSSRTICSCRKPFPRAVKNVSLRGRMSA